MAVSTTNRNKAQQHFHISKWKYKKKQILSKRKSKEDQYRPSNTRHGTTKTKNTEKMIKLDQTQGKSLQKYKLQ